MKFSELQQHTYVPYSGSAEIAVVQSKSGAWFPGVRIENISFPLTISAIQNALFCCLSEGETPEIMYVDAQPEHNSIHNYWKEQYQLALNHIDKLTDANFAPIIKSVEDIPLTLHKLLGSALAEYSDFPVSALLQTGSGFISGVNIETADWSRGLCAERIAIAKAISYGLTDFKALYICTRDGEYSSPCGACRQVIIEHLSHHPVHLYHADGTTARHFSSDLLPYNFQSSSLQNKFKDD